MKHIHCLICSSPTNVIEEKNFSFYVCDRCMKSFPDDYILYRINCRKNGIHRKSFDFLESRLTFGDLSGVVETNTIYNESILE